MRITLKQSFLNSIHTWRSENKYAIEEPANDLGERFGQLEYLKKIDIN